MPRRHHLKSTNWVSGGQGGVVSCFHAGDSFVEVRGGLIDSYSDAMVYTRGGSRGGPGGQNPPLLGDSQTS